MLKAMLIGVMFCGALLFARGAQGDDMSMDISGTWRLNKQLSDDPRQVMQAKMTEMREKRGGGGGYGGGGRSGLDSDAVQKRLDQFDAARTMIRIDQSDGIVTMAYADSSVINIPTDGQERDVETPRGSVKRYASWLDFSLVVHTKTRDDSAMTRIYRINDDGQLEIVTKVNPRQMPEPIEIVAVYDLLPSGSQ